MNKQLVFIIVSFLILLKPGIGSAQDHLITSTGDTISGEIIKVTNKYIQYKTLIGGVPAKMKTDRNHIQSWTTEESYTMDMVVPSIKKLHFSIQSGYGYRTASTKDAEKQLVQQGYASDDAKSYYKKMKWGYEAGAQAHYLISPTLGIGLDYQLHRSSGEISGYIEPDYDIVKYYTTMHEDVYTNYVGLSLYSQYWISPQKINFHGQISAGMAFFREEAKFNYNPLLITGNSFGSNLEVGIEYFITDKLALGLKANHFISTITKIKVESSYDEQEIELEDEERENLSRLNLSLGFSFYF
jgi:hypothetical protein